MCHILSSKFNENEMYRFLKYAKFIGSDVVFKNLRKITVMKAIYVKIRQNKENCS